jgi:hypothetical protein
MSHISLSAANGPSFVVRIPSTLAIFVDLLLAGELPDSYADRSIETTRSSGETSRPGKSHHLRGGFPDPSPLFATRPLHQANDCSAGLAEYIVTRSAVEDDVVSISRLIHLLPVLLWSHDQREQLLVTLVREVDDASWDIAVAAMIKLLGTTAKCQASMLTPTDCNKVSVVFEAD